jgi:hypothetical protein
MAAAARLPVAQQMVEPVERSPVALAVRPLAPVAMPMAVAAPVEQQGAPAVPQTWMPAFAPVTPATPAANNFPP